jgi:hypothetical protein
LAQCNIEPAFGDNARLIAPKKRKAHTFDL